MSMLHLCYILVMLEVQKQTSYGDYLQIHAVRTFGRWLTKQNYRLW